MMEKRKSTSSEQISSEKQAGSSPESKLMTPSMQKGHWSLGGWFWGLSLITIGTLMLLGNLGILEVNWSNIWRLWPLAVIASGLSLINVRHWAWKTFLLLCVAVSLGLVLYVAVGGYDNSRSLRTVGALAEKSSDVVVKADIILKAGASKIEVYGDDVSSSTIVRSTLKSESSRISQGSERRGDTQRITLSSIDRNKIWILGSNRHDWTLSLNKELPVSLTFDAGASILNADLHDIRLEKLTIKAGASNMRVSFGSKSPSIQTVIDAGASNIVLRIPRQTGVKLEMEGGITSKNLADLRETTEHTYISDNYEATDQKIFIKAFVGASQFTIQRY